MIKKYWCSLLFLGLALGLSSCSSETSLDKETGSVRLSVSESALFTRSVDLSALENTKNYTIDIYDSQDVCVLSQKLGDIQDQTVELEAGSYNLIATYGSLKAASQDDLQMKGEASFTVETGKTAQASCTCTPQSARVNVSFSEKMATYFSDYYVTFSTKALTAEGSSAVWSKDNADAWYLKVDDQETVKATIHVTRLSDGKTMTVERSYALSKAMAWTLDIDVLENQAEDGSLTFTLSVDESTNDIEEDIVVPDEWWM